MWPQGERWCEGFVGDDGGASAHRLDGDHVGVAVLYAELHLVLEFLRVVQVGDDGHGHLGPGGDLASTGFDPPARALAHLREKQVPNYGRSCGALWSAGRGRTKRYEGKKHGGLISLNLTYGVWKQQICRSLFYLSGSRLSSLTQFCPTQGIFIFFPLQSLLWTAHPVEATLFLPASWLRWPSFRSDTRTGEARTAQIFCQLGAQRRTP